MRSPHKPLSFRLQYLLLRMLPQHALSRAMYHLARSERPWIRKRLIRYVIREYQVDMTEAAQPDPDQYPSFNAFFTRTLRPDTRPIAADSIISPADGQVSQSGAIDDQQLIQAKGQHYTLPALLGDNTDLADMLRHGSYLTIYLAPKDYHRVHMPLSGTLQHMTYIPGDLFSVNTHSAQHIPGLFTRNERLVCTFDTACGPMVVIWVGAIFVGNIETVWAGEVQAKTLTHRDYSDQAHTFATGDEIGRFNMGSTVIVLFGANQIDLLPTLTGQKIQMGQQIAPKPDARGAQ
ncbi:MAG: archaetidylserine decarboxylase [Pseudomonadota bacterium]